MKSQRIKPSELLKLLKQTGQSYWDLVGNPLPQTNTVEEFDSGKNKGWRPSVKFVKAVQAWEGSDYPKNVPIDVKLAELQNIMGKSWYSTTEGERLALLDVYYNTSPKSFKKYHLPLWNKYLESGSYDDYKLLQNSVRDRWKYAPAKYQNGIRRRAIWNANLMTDRVFLEDPELNLKAPADATMVAKPTIVNPIKAPTKHKDNIVIPYAAPPEPQQIPMPKFKPLLPNAMDFYQLMTGDQLPRLQQHDGGTDDGIFSSNGMYHVNPEDYLSVLNSSMLNVYVPDIVVTAKKPQKFGTIDPDVYGGIYRTSFHPEDTKTFFDVAAGGPISPLNWITPNVFALSEYASTGDWKQAANEASKILLPMDNAVGHIAKIGYGTHNLIDENGLQKTYLFAKSGRYGRAALSFLGDVLNATMAASGVKNTLPYAQQAVDKGLYYVGKLGKQLKNTSMRNWAANRLFSRQLEKGFVDNGNVQSGKLNNLNIKNVIGLPRKQEFDLLQILDTYGSKKIPISAFIDESGKVNTHNIVSFLNQYYRLNERAIPINRIINRDNRLPVPNRTTLREHSRDVLRTSMQSPLAKGATRQELSFAALAHDFGKILGGDDHGQIGAAELDKYIDLPKQIKNAIADHMSTTSRLSDNLLLKATLFADVARGLSYDQAAFRYPYLLYDRDVPKSTFTPAENTYEMLRKRISPYFSSYGYPTFNKWAKQNNIGVTDKTATGELAEQYVRSILNQNRTFARGVRIPRTTQGVSDYVSGNINAQNLSEMSILLTGLDSPKGRLLAAETSVQKTPTGYGKADLFDYVLDNNGVPRVKLNFTSEHLKIDPKNLDGVYVSNSTAFANTYASRNGEMSGEIALVGPKIKDRLPEESLELWIIRNKLYPLEAGAVRMSRNPIGSSAVYDDVYRLYTGRSLLKDMLSSGEYPSATPKLIPAKTKPKVDQNELATYSRTQPVGTNSTTYANVAENVNKIFKENGVDFRIIPGKDGKYYYPKYISKINDDLVGLTKVFKSPEYSNLQQTLSSLKNKQTLDANDKDKLRKAIIEFNRVLGRDVSYETSAAIMKNVPIYKNTSSTKRLYNAANNIVLQNALKKVAYIYNTRFKTTSAQYNARLDFKDAYRILRDPDNLALFMRERGIMPAYDLPGFLNPLIIGQSDKRSQLGKRYTSGVKPKAHRYIFVDKRGSVPLQKLLSDVKPTGTTNKRRRDSGTYDDRLSRVIARSIFPIGVLGSSFVLDDYSRNKNSGVHIK